MARSSNRPPTRELKHCPSCRKDKVLTDFALNRAKSDGLDSWCKTCNRKRQRKYAKTGRHKGRTLSSPSSPAVTVPWFGTEDGSWLEGTVTGFSSSDGAPTLVLMDATGTDDGDGGVRKFTRIEVDMDSPSLKGWVALVAQDDRVRIELVGHDGPVERYAVTILEVPHDSSERQIAAS